MKESIVAWIWRNKQCEQMQAVKCVQNRSRKDHHVTPEAQSPTETKVKFLTTPEPEEIASLAYTLWQQRGCPEGSPEADWLQAEEELATSR
jgi:hypothetical protein